MHHPYEPANPEAKVEYGLQEEFITPDFINRKKTDGHKSASIRES